MKRFLRCVCLLLALVIVFPFRAFAAEESSARASNFFMSSSVYLDQKSSMIFDAWFEVAAVGTMDELGASVIKIQKSADNENWTTMITYTKEKNSSLIDTNTLSHGNCVTYTGVAGYYYRAYIKLYAKKGDDIGVWHRYTESILLG